MCRDRLHERWLREAERDAECGDDDADEDEAVGAPNERRTLLAGSNESPRKRDTHVGESSVEGSEIYPVDDAKVRGRGAEGLRR